MKLLSELTQIFDFTAYNAAAGGGRTERISVPIHHAAVQFPESTSIDLDGILITGDLQFYDRKSLPEEDRRLMGYAVAGEISALSAAGLLPATNRLGVVIVGDMYAEPCLLKRGGSGDVEDIWYEFADHFRWVAGVAGNHDLYEGKDQFPKRFKSQSNIHALDFETVELDGLKIGGVSGIMGNPKKIWRYTDEDFRKKLPRLLSSPLDCLVLHQGPRGKDSKMRGSTLINETLQQSPNKPSIVTFGHCHWPEPISEADQATTLLNSDGRAVLLTRPGVKIDL